MHMAHVQKIQSALVTLITCEERGHREGIYYVQILLCLRAHHLCNNKAQLVFRWYVWPPWFRLRLLEICINTSITHAIYFQLKTKPCTVDDHFEGKVQVVELDPFGCGEASEQAPRNSVQVSRQFAHVDQFPCICSWGFIRLTRDQVVRDQK